MIDLIDNEARYLAILNRELVKRLDQHLEPLDIGTGQYPFLFSLYIEDGRSQQDLADAIGVDKAAAARALQKLEAADYIYRRRDICDKRITRVYLTDRARALKPKLRRGATQSLNALCEPLSSEERHTLKTLLARMVGAL